MLLVTLGTGIGGAIAIDGQIYRGEGFAGEWGHMKVMHEGLLCDCGKRGCWETVASGPALERLAREVVSANPSSSLALALDGESADGCAVVVAPLTVASRPPERWSPRSGEASGSDSQTSRRSSIPS